MSKKPCGVVRLEERSSTVLWYLNVYCGTESERGGFTTVLWYLNVAHERGSLERGSLERGSLLNVALSLER